MEFKPFPKISRLEKVWMRITQKIHGTNAQVVVTEAGEVLAGSRSRWITPGDDNFGFAAFVKEHEAFFAKLGVGAHYGEWAGPGINSGEGLRERTFVLFEPWRYKNKELPPRVVTVPVLYEGALDTSKILESMERLKEHGSLLVPGFMRPEGVVVSIGGSRYKAVFAPEETEWNRPREAKTRAPREDFSALLQPIRLEKLLSREERLQREYPSTLPEIVRLYIEDLEAEGKAVGARKELSRSVFMFVKEIVGKST